MENSNELIFQTATFDERCLLLPPMFRVQQRFQQPAIDDVGAVLSDQLRQYRPKAAVVPGQSVAVAVGSRGIQRLPEIVRSVVEELKRWRLEPFIVPAMGSHGGATADGQVAVLARLGIRPDTMRVLVTGDAEAAPIARLPSGVRVCVGRRLLAADHVVVINRVKPHTLFRSEVESGLCKMLAVGCGTPAGAAEMHRFGLAASIVPAAAAILSHVSVLFGVAVVENPAPGVHAIEIVRPADFATTDRRLLKLAWKCFPRIPLETLDVLVVDEMGKNISGAGMDPNVVGFWRREGGERRPDYHTLLVLDLTDESHGNAVGIGMADLVPQRLVEKMDLAATQTNAATTGLFRSARLPLVLASDRDAVGLALSRVPDLERVRLVRIKNTHLLHTFWVTGAVLPQLEENASLEIRSSPDQFRYSTNGKLPPLSFG
jgi:hypothetical protein